MTFVLCTTTPTVVFFATIQVAETQHAVFSLLHFCILITHVCLFPPRKLGEKEQSDSSQVGRQSLAFHCQCVITSVGRDSVRKNLLRAAAL